MEALCEPLEKEESAFLREVVRGVRNLSEEMLSFLKFEVARKEHYKA